MMLTQRISMLASDLAKQCHVSPVRVGEKTARERLVMNDRRRGEGGEGAYMHWAFTVNCSIPFWLFVQWNLSYRTFSIADTSLNRTKCAVPMESPLSVILYSSPKCGHLAIPYSGHVFWSQQYLDCANFTR